MKLGKIQKLDLRDIWESEDKDFTPWLAKDDNITALGETIGIDLEVESQEKNVGPFRADILAKDTATNHFVLIENQLEQTDHKHLGQIMTYAAGLDAFSVIWIAKQFTEEHRAAIDWLNRITDESINFFAIEIEVIRINESEPAAQFNVVAKPNGWSKSVKSAASNSELSDTKIKQQNYWSDFRDYANVYGAQFKVQKPLPQHWTNVAIGRSGFVLTLNVNSVKSTISVNLQIETDIPEDNKKFFDFLKSNYGDEAALKISPDLVWLRMDDKKASYITLSANYNFLDPSTRQEQFDWFLTTTSKLRNFFKDKIKNLK